jgi:hypothetical protein
MKNLSKLPMDIIYEIILFTRDPYTEERKKLMRSIRREYMRKIMIKAQIPHSHAWRILDVDATINELLDDPPAIHSNSEDSKFNITIVTWLKIHRYIQNSQHFPIGHHFYPQSNSPVLDYSIWRWRRIAEINHSS